MTPRQRRAITSRSQRSLDELAGRIDGTAQAFLDRPDFSAEEFGRLAGDQPLLREAIRMAMIANLIDKALNHKEPGSDLRPIVETMARVLGIEVAEWEDVR